MIKDNLHEHSNISHGASAPTGITVLDSGLGRWMLDVMERFHRGELFFVSLHFDCLKQFNTNLSVHFSTGTKSVRLLCPSSCPHCCFSKEERK